MSEQDLGPRPGLKWLPTTDLVVDERYQRSISKRGRGKINRITAEFQWAKFGALVVAGPDKLKDYHVLDGQHRLLAARQAGVDTLPCCVIKYTDVADEARAFIGINRDRLTATQQQVFHAAVAAGEPAECAIMAMVTAAGLKVGESHNDFSKPGYIIAVGSLRQCYQLSPKALAIALEILGETQKDCAGTLKNQVLRTVTRFIAQHGDGISRERLVKTLDPGEVDLVSWVEAAMQSKELFGNKSEVALQARLTQAYNKGLGAGNRLPAPAGF